MTHVIAYLPDVEEEIQKPMREAIRNYAGAQGWPPLYSDNWIMGVVGLDAEGKPLDVLADAARAIPSGGHLLLPKLGDISDLPSKQRSLIQSLIGRGARVHVMNLGGDISPHLPGLNASWEAMSSLEERAERLATAIAELEVTHRAAMTAYGESAINAALAKFGPDHFIKRDEDGDLGPGEPNPVGDFIRKQRERLGLNQKELAARIGVSKSQFNRAELKGEGGKSLTTILDFLATATPETKEPKQ